jgi:beta-lactamase regulating signal transducer with metallopeptidase domain
MSDPIAALNSVARAWGALAWAVTWQLALLVGVFALVSLAMRRSSPGLRYWLWQIAAIKLLVMPVWGISLPLPPARPATSPAPNVRLSARPGETPGAASAGWGWARTWIAATGGSAGPTAGGRPPTARLDGRAWLFLGWALAVALQAAAILHRRGLLERLLLQARPADDPALLAEARALSGAIGLRWVPEVRIADVPGSPFVCGLWSPVLVLPRGLVGSVGPESLRPVLLHELAHLQRRDLLWGWIPALARLLYFFHPAAYYIDYRIRLERELACDQAAMLLSGQGAAGYATTLVEIVSQSSRSLVT